MDNPNCNSKNVLVELESLKSKECIFKMKETNYIRDKEILEDSIQKFQSDLQEKSETIRSLRRDLNTQSSDLYKDLQIKSNELEKVIVENEDLKKQNVIFQETIDHHVQRIETLKLDMDKQQKFYEREIECKSRLAGFYESSNQQKENKISLLSNENEQFKRQISDMKLKFNEIVGKNEAISKNHEESLKRWKVEEGNMNQEIERMKNEMLQLQQNGMSELHLEKMNPTAAATLKVLKSSKGLMDIYSELHRKISEVDQLQMEKDRLTRNNDALESELQKCRVYVDRANRELEEGRATCDSLKSRMLSLVTELRAVTERKNNLKRQLLVTGKNLESSNQEIQRLNEQVRLFVVITENGSQIKQEAVDADSGLYSSVQELQEINRALRIENEDLLSQLELSDNEQFKTRCEELQAYSDKLSGELDQLRQEHSASQSQLILHEKQVKLMRFLIELKSPGTTEAIENGLKRLEPGHVISVDCEHEPEMRCLSALVQPPTKEEFIDQSCQQTDFDLAIDELMEKKRASDEVYVASIEQMRIQLMEYSRNSSQLQDKLDSVNDELKEMKDTNEKYYEECRLLRSLNRNLSSNTANLESHIEELKVKIAAKITLLAERKAELDNCKNVIDMTKSELVRLRVDRDELRKTVDIQEQILANITSLQSGANLADHLSRSQAQETIVRLTQYVDEMTRALAEAKEDKELLINQLSESRALEAIVTVVDRCEVECQVDMPTVQEVTETPLSPECSTPVPVDNSALTDCLDKIATLQQQLVDDKYDSSQAISELQSTIDKYEQDIRDLTQKCEFFETQISLQEKARQEILSENIKLTEEAHEMNASLKRNLHTCQDELVALKVRLEEAENVERTVQIVIDKHVKEANEAKAKYKRELTLHASDSKLLDAANKEIEQLKSIDKSIDNECVTLKSELATCKETLHRKIDELKSINTNLETKLQECENRNERLYDQLRQLTNEDGNCGYLEVIEDLRNQINIDKMSSSLSSVQIERYENEIARLREEIGDMKEQSSLVIDRMNKSQCDENATITMDAEVIRESNFVLRQQKEQLERTVQSQTNDMEELSLQLQQLEETVVQLTEARDDITKTNRDLEEEKNRWKDRCTKLVERAEQMDPEQYKSACNDRDKFRKQVDELKVSVAQMQAAFESSVCKEDQTRLQLAHERERTQNQEETVRQLEALLATVKAELGTCHEKQEADRTKLKKEATAVTQLREIAKKYKGESENLKQAMIELDTRIVELTNRLHSVTADKEQLASDLIKRTDSLDELRSRCDCLEQINREHAMKIQLKESMITELNAGLRQMESDDSNGRLTSKRSNQEDGSGPNCKRGRFGDNEDGSSGDDGDDESEEEEEEEEERDVVSLDGIGQDKEGVYPGGGEDDNDEEDNVDKLDEGELGGLSDQGMEMDNVEVEEEYEEEDNAGGRERSENMQELKENPDKYEIGTSVDNQDIESVSKEIREDEEVLQIDESCENSLNQLEEDKEYEDDKEGSSEEEEGEINDDKMNGEEEQDLEENEEMEETDQRTEEAELEENDDNDEQEVQEEEEDEEDDASVVVIEDSDSNEQSGNEEDYDALVAVVENSLVNVEGDLKKETQITDEKPLMVEDLPKPLAVIAGGDCDQSWNEKLVSMVASSLLNDEKLSPGTESVINKQVATRGRRRPLRRPNQTD